MGHDAAVGRALGQLRHRDGPLRQRRHGRLTLTVQNLPGADIRTAVSYVAKVRADIATRADRMRVCTSAAAIRQARADGVLALVLQHQDGTPLGGMVEMVEVYHALGVRCMLPVYNGKNALADGCAERTDEGLTRLGQRSCGRCCGSASSWTRRMSACGPAWTWRSCARRRASP